jgi:hypothetical protein
MKNRTPIWLSAISALAFFFLEGCCFGERFFREQIDLDYSNYTADTVYNQYTVSIYGIDTSLHQVFGDIDGNKIYPYFLRYDYKNDTGLTIIELPISHHRDTLTASQFSLKGQCKNQVYNQSIIVNGVRKYGEKITM